MQIEERFRDTKLKTLPFSGDIYNHQPFALDIEELLPIFAPVRLLTSCGGDLPFGAGRRKALNVDFKSTRLIGFVSQPFHIWGNTWLTLIILCEQEDRLPAVSRG